MCVVTVCTVGRRFTDRLRAPASYGVLCSKSQAAPADRPGAGGVPDLGQVPQLDPRIVAVGFEPVIAVLGVVIGLSVTSRSGCPLAPVRSSQVPSRPAARARWWRRGEPGPYPVPRGASF